MLGVEFSDLPVICNGCDRLDRCAMITGIGGDGLPIELPLEICGACLAELIEGLTGFKAMRAYRSWTVSSALRLSNEDRRNIKEGLHLIGSQDSDSSDDGTDAGNP